MICKFYKPILLALLCFGIDTFPKSQNSYRCLKIVAFVLNSIITIATILIGIKSAANLNVEFSLFLIILTGMVFKYSLFKKRRMIFDFIMHLSKNKYIIKSLPHIIVCRKKINFILFYILVSPAIWSIIILPNLKENPIITEEMKFSSILKKYNISSSINIAYAESSLNFVIPTIFGIYPMKAFFLLYSVITWQLMVSMDYF